MRFIFSWVLVAVSGLWVVPAVAGPFEDALVAAQRGDFATTASLLRPLVDAGDPAAQYNLGILYENGEGVQSETNRVQQPHLPDHGRHRTHKWQHAQHKGPHIELEQQTGQNQGDREESDDLGRGVGHVIDHFRETDDVNAGVLILELVANLLQPIADRRIVDRLPGNGIEVQQLADHHRRALIVRDETAYDIRLGDIGA